MNEIDEYREMLERQYEDRRELKNDRRRHYPETKHPKMFDSVFVIHVFLFVGLLTALYFFGR